MNSRRLPHKRKATSLPISTGRIDFYLLATVLCLVIFGILMIYNASSVVADKTFNNTYFFLKEQAISAVIGIIAMGIISFIDYHFWKKWAFHILIFNIILLILVFIPGFSIRAYGASRWIHIGGFNLQPSELAKISLVIYLSSWFSSKEYKKLRTFLLLVGGFIGLVMLQPDMGTSTVLAALSLTLYYLSGAPIRQFLMLGPIGAALGTILIFFESYRLQRLLTFLDPSRDPLGSGYHIHQTLLALGNGGLMGLGLGQSRQKYGYLPESNTDSIFAIIAEETGFLGATVLVLVFLFFLVRGFTIAKLAKDEFGKYLALGITSYLLFQVIINLGAQVALFPFTGIPLPFISYGGSSLVVNLVAVGILLSISRSNA